MATPDEADVALLTLIPTIDDVLIEHRTALRGDFVAYRNHVYRIVNLCTAIAGRSELEKITSSTAGPGSLVEAFRRADWIDVTRGLRAFGMPRSFVARLFATWPDTGFHRRLVTLTLDRFRHHPLTPLPMLRL